VTVINYIWL